MASNTEPDHSDDPAPKNEGSTRSGQQASSDAGDDEHGDDSGAEDGGRADVLGQLEAGLSDLRAFATGLSADAKDKWEEMEPQLKERLKLAEGSLEHLGEQAAKELKGAISGLKKSMRSLKDKFE